MPQPVRVPKAAALVAASLRRRIVLGELARGDSLPNESELMEYYSVSRPTLREALRILETESLIVVKRGARGGARVAHPEPSITARHAATLLYLQETKLQDVFDARLVIEPAAVELLAERAKDDSSILDPLREVHAASFDARDDLQTYAAIAARFHELVVELAGSKTLTLIALMLLEIVEQNNRVTFEAIDAKTQVVDHAQHQHETFLKMLESNTGDPAGYWRAHMLYARDAALRALGPDARIAFIDGAG